MNGMNKSDYYFELPQELIAQTPIMDRSSSRLLVLNKSTGEIEHKIFRDIVSLINPGDCVVINDTRVIPARLMGRRENTGAVIEVLLLKRLDRERWEVLVKPGRRAKTGCVIRFGDGKLTGTIEDITGEGSRIIRFDFDGIFEEILNELGEMPLPPYITEKLKEPERYQTVYAVHEGSAAAPTAGLHFTEEILSQLKDKGVHVARVTLHVGLGTFKPVKSESILEHKMHSEYYHLREGDAHIINDAKQNGGKIIAVGTTSCRVLETLADQQGTIKSASGWTDIFIYPGYEFKIVDSLITNFHIPESTLLMLVSAMCGRENILRAYGEAVKERYRFFSFGDAMLIHER